MRSHSITHARAKALRSRLSPPEVLLRVSFRARHPDLPRWRRQRPISPYVADFDCSAARLAVEIDGSSHGEDARIVYGEVRDRYLRRLGYHVFRISAAEVMSTADEVADGVVQTALGLIREAAGARPYAPSVTARDGAAPPPPQEGG
jgi:very-short-patch-repair endonuclease